MIHAKSLLTRMHDKFGATLHEMAWIASGDARISVIRAAEAQLSAFDPSQPSIRFHKYLRAGDRDCSDRTKNCRPTLV
jgi:hypothetical protein